MKKLSVLFFSAICFVALNTNAQNYNTGDADMDKALTNISASANSDFDSFKATMVAKSKAPENKINAMKADGMDGGEIFLTLYASRLSNKSIDETLSIYKANKNKGWGYVLTTMGISSDSESFKKIKNQSINMSRSNSGKSPTSKSAADQRSGRGSESSSKDKSNNGNSNTKTSRTGGREKR